MADEIARDDVERFFERYGWSCEAIDEGTVRTGFRGTHGSFTAIVRVTPHWVIFTINPYVRPPQGGWGQASLTALAATNQAMHMAKLGFDPDEDVFLTVELPSESFGYAHFEAAMTTISTSADAFLLPLLQARAIDERNP